MIKHTAIRESINNANRLITKYVTEHNQIDKDLKPEVQSERRAKLFTEFSTAIKDDLLTLRAATQQLREERIKTASAFDTLMATGMAGLGNMNPGETWLANNFDKVPPAKLETFTHYIIKNGSDSLRFALLLQLSSPSTPEEARARDSLVADVKQSPQTQAWLSEIAKLEKDTHLALLDYESRPGTGKTVISRKIETGHLIHELDLIITHASDYGRATA